MVGASKPRDWTQIVSGDGERVARDGLVGKWKSYEAREVLPGRETIA